MRQRRPADPTDPGDAADLSIMGYFKGAPWAIFRRSGGHPFVVSAHLRKSLWKATVS